MIQLQQQHELSSKFRAGRGNLRPIELRELPSRQASVMINQQCRSHSADDWASPHTNRLHLETPRK